MIILSDKGWYFSVGEGEQEFLHGPYKTMEAARAALALYLGAQNDDSDGYMV